MSYVAAVVMMHIDDVEEAFWLFLKMIDDFLQPYFEEKMTGILRDRVIFTRILRRCHPELAAHLVR